MTYLHYDKLWVSLAFFKQVSICNEQTHSSDLYRMAKGPMESCNFNTVLSSSDMITVRQNINLYACCHRKIRMLSLLYVVVNDSIEIVWMAILIIILVFSGTPPSCKQH